MTLGGLLSSPPAIVAAGVDVFSDALRAQGAEVHDVDWRPPGFGDPDDLTAIALDPRRAAANRTAVERVLAAGSLLTDVRPARDVLELPDRVLLHSGPPLTWETASGPATVRRRASTRGCASTTTVSPSRSPRFDSTSSSHRTLPGGQSSGAITADSGWLASETASSAISSAAMPLSAYQLSRK